MKKKTKKSSASLLLDLFSTLEGSELFHDPEKRGYVDVRQGDHRETFQLQSRDFRLFLSGFYYENTHRAIGNNAIVEAIGVLECEAAFRGPERQIFTRIGSEGEAIYLDLGDSTWRAAKIIPGAWSVVLDPPVRFRRGRGTFALPEPVAGGSIEDLRPFINVDGDEDWHLIVVWLSSCLRARGPFVHLALHGEQGSAKSTATKVLKAMIDPGKAPLRSEPKEVRDFMIACENSLVLTFDNLSHLQQWVSDSLCRLSTGGGFSTRTLFENREEELFESERPVIFNGIEELASSGDLVDRSLILTLPEITEEKRREETEFWKAFQDAKPRILGALLQLVADAMAILPAVKLERLPRMADFAKWGTAVEQVLGWKRGSFDFAYTLSRKDGYATALDASPAGRAFYAFMDSKMEWSGTAQELLKELEKTVDEKVLRKTSWPQSPRGLAGVLRRLSRVLKTLGIEVLFSRESDKSRDRVIHARVVLDDTFDTGEFGFNRPDSPNRPDSLGVSDDVDGSDGGSATLENRVDHDHD